MALEAYSPCPCGSGKKFKWCCQPIHVEIDKALRQDADGQHEAALRTMDAVVAEHPGNPEAWGRRAQLLYQNDRPDDAETSLQKAFDLSPKYPYGHLLQGLFRQHEGEVPGALLLFRKAAEYYDPEAKDVLAQVYSMIAECEMKLNRPVAARAALKISLHCRPNDEVQQLLTGLFGDGSHLPAAARREYVFSSPHAGAHPTRLAAWEKALAVAASGKLADVQRAFEQLTSEHAEDAAAWYNLGLTRAWLGDNRRALEALDRYVSLEPDEGRAAAAWTLAEVLRFGQGMENEADYVEHSAAFQVRQPQQFFAFLNDLEQERRLAGVQVRQEEGIISALVLEKKVALTPESAASQPSKMAAYLLIMGPVLRVWHTNAESVDKVRQELQQRAGSSLSDPQTRRGPAAFGDALADAIAVPVGVTEQAEFDRQVRDFVQRFFEETWLHLPFKSLGGVPPVDAAGHSPLRKKLAGVIQFLQECQAITGQAYDFDRLRRKLGLLQGGPAEPVATASAPDITAMGTAELAGLATDALSEEQLEQAYQTAQRLDAHELGGRFARALVARPARVDKPDRYPWYSYLVQRALAENDAAAALSILDEAAKADREQNEGKRQNDYDLRRGQVLTKQGDADAARSVFEQLIARAPTNLRFRSTAAEAMLTLKRGPHALAFAEQGLTKAREQNDRDSEGHFMELVAAAKKQGG